MNKEIFYHDPPVMSSQDPGSTEMVDHFYFPEETAIIIKKENLLPGGLLNRLHAGYPQYSGLRASNGYLFTGKERYEGLKGFREIVGILQQNSIQIGFLQERELFIKVYRFLATKHVLNSINWNDFREDSLFQLVFPQPGMITADIVHGYLQAQSENEREALVADYIQKTNPHDGKQKLNKPWFKNADGEIEIVDGSQHKYPQCQLIFDKTTQHCFAFCTYCFRHAQVRGDQDMFVQNDINQVHEYLKRHKEVTDVLITGGDAGFVSYERLKEYYPNP